MNGFIVLLLVLFTLCSSDCKNFSRCDLAVELLRNGFPETQLRDWVCLVEAESSRRTDAVGGPDDDGSFDYGLFQINDRYWCNSGLTRGKECHLRCPELLDEDISVASKCAQKIYRIQGFDAWVGWVNECYNKKLPDISKCIRR